jgi:hypothetical protein
VLSRTIEMKRAGLVLGMFACGSSRPPVPAETKVAAAAEPTVASTTPDAEPTPGKKISTTGRLLDRIDEREGAVESTDHVDVAIVASQVDADYDVTVSQQGMPYHDSTTRHFAVTVKRVHDLDDCK